MWNILRPDKWIESDIRAILQAETTSETESPQAAVLETENPEIGVKAEISEKDISCREKDLFLVADFAKSMREGKVDEALNFAWEIADDLPAKSRSLFAVFMKYWREGEREKALKLADRGKEFNFFLNVFSTLQTPEAIQSATTVIIDHIENEAPSDNWESNLIWWEMTSGLVEFGMIDEAIEFASRMTDPSYRSRATLKICCPLVMKLGDIDKAMSVIARIGDKSSNFTRVFRTLMPVGKNKILHLISVLNQISDPTERQFAFAKSSDELFATEEVDTLIEFYRGMPVGEVRGKALIKLVNVLLEQEDPLKVLEVTKIYPGDISEIGKLDVDGLWFFWALKKFVKFNRVDEAISFLIQVYSTMPVGDGRDKALIGLVKVILEGEDPEKALKVANMHPGDASDARGYLYFLIVEKFVKLNQVDQAASFVDELIGAYDILTFGLILGQFIVANQIDKTFLVISKMSEGANKVQALSIIVRMCQFKKLGVATIHKSVALITDDGDKDKFYIAIIDALLEKKDLAKAKKVAHMIRNLTKRDAFLVELEAKEPHRKVVLALE